MHYGVQFRVQYALLYTACVHIMANVVYNLVLYVLYVYGSMLFRTWQF